jgi:hypothetical protein
MIPMEVLPRGEVLGGRLEHPRPVSLLLQHPCRVDGRSVYRVGLSELAVKVGFPDTLHCEVRQIVHAFTGHEPSLS